MTSATLLESVANQATEIRVALDALALVAVGVLALLMQAGFAVLDAGLVRSKNVAHTTALVLLATAAGLLGFWSVGFGIQNGFRGFLFSPPSASGSALLFVAMAALATISATIPAGAMAERSRLVPGVLLSFVVAGVIFPMYASWVWTNGWLAKLPWGHGVVDCAGSSVVHMTGGGIAIVASKLLGPRLGKFTLRGDVRPILAHNMPMVVLGTLLLSAAWLGLATASAAHNAASLAGTMAVHTLIASAGGALLAFAHTRFRFGKPDLSMTCNGLFAGLVAISAAGPFVSSISSFIIGSIGALFALEGGLLLERRLRLDDPAGAVAVHGIGGIWGLLAVGIFADGRAGDGWNGVSGPIKGLLAGNGGQLLASAVGVVANVAWVVPIAALALWLIGRVAGGHRVAADDEVAGLDVPELGMAGYVSEAAHGGAARGGDAGHRGHGGGHGESSRPEKPFPATAR
jgi:ammonium transporter, Amt family